MLVVSLAIVYTPRVYFLLRAEEPVTIESFPSEDYNHKPERESRRKNYERSSFKSKKAKYTRPTTKFNPNTYGKDDWIRLGLSTKQADVVVNFVKRGISSNDQLKKIYVLPGELFELIKDSTYYPEEKELSVAQQKPVSTPKYVDINTATSDELISLKGIGPFFAKQIIKRREELGGFARKDQLLEVWKMDQEKYDLIESSIHINPEHISKLSINNASVDELKSHPYISWNVANSIVKMRAQIKEFKKVEEVMESVLIDQELFFKLKPYLSL